MAVTYMNRESTVSYDGYSGQEKENKAPVKLSEKERKMIVRERLIEHGVNALRELTMQAANQIMPRSVVDRDIVAEILDRAEWARPDIEKSLS